jgi:intracellular septation protein
VSEVRAEKKMPHGIKMATDFGPLLAFFGANWMWGIYTATAVLMVAIAAAFAVTWKMTHKVAPMLVVTLVFVLVFGGLTIYLENDTFIKVKVTLVNALLGSILLVGLLFGRSFLKSVMGEMLKMDDEGWRKLSLRWGLFFFCLAGLNEIVWRSVSTDTWVTFKVFGLMGITMAFGLAQIPLMTKHMIEEGKTRP